MQSCNFWQSANTNLSPYEKLRLSLWSFIQFAAILVFAYTAYNFCKLFLNVILSQQSNKAVLLALWGSMKASRQQKIGKNAVELTLECLKMNHSSGIKKPDTYVPGFLKYILLNLFKSSFVPAQKHPNHHEGHQYLKNP